MLCAVSLSACAQAPTAAADEAEAAPAQAVEARIVTEPGTPEDRARQAIESINPEIRIDAIAASPLAGFQEVIVGGQALYVSDDGKYLIQGSLFDIGAKRDLSQAGVNAVRRRLLATVPASERIVFAPPNPRYTVSVFTDVECGYCRKLHSEIEQLNKLGVRVRYMAYPRAGPGTDDWAKMESVWCSKDRKTAITQAKQGNEVKAQKCATPVAKQYELGEQLGVRGTPAIFTKTGAYIGGYLPPQELVKQLDELAQQGKE